MGTAAPGRESIAGCRATRHRRAASSFGRNSLAAARSRTRWATIARRRRPNNDSAGGRPLKPKNHRDSNRHTSMSPNPTASPTSNESGRGLASDPVPRSQPGTSRRTRRRTAEVRYFHC